MVKKSIKSIKSINGPSKDLDASIDFKEYLKKRLEDIKELGAEDLKSVILFLEYQVICMSLELKTIEYIEIEKEGMLDIEDASDEELEEKFDDLAEYLQERIMHFDDMNKNFQEAFAGIASPTAEKFIEQYSSDKDESFEDSIQDSIIEKSTKISKTKTTNKKH